MATVVSQHLRLLGRKYEQSLFFLLSSSHENDIAKAGARKVGGGGKTVSAQRLSRGSTNSRGKIGADRSLKIISV